MFKPDNEGFLRHWIVSGVLETDVPDHIKELANEDLSEMSLNVRSIPVKKIIFDDNLKVPPSDIGLNKLSSLGLPYKYHSMGSAIFVDLSRFYYTMKKGELYAVTDIISQEDREITARAWYFPCMNIWLNDELVFSDKYYEHTPITYSDFRLNLKKGSNRLFVRAQILGIVNAYSMFAIKLLEGFSDLKLSLPGDKTAYENILSAEKWLSSVKLDGNRLISDTKPEFEVKVYADYDHHASNSLIYNVWDKETYFTIDITRFSWYNLEIEVEGHTLKRALEAPKRCCFNENITKKAYIDKLCDTKIKVVGSDTAQYLLAQYFSKNTGAETKSLLYKVIKNIEKRNDCSDFSLAALIRMYILCDDLPNNIKNDLKKLFLEFRYWMDEEGNDSMAMGTENHSLLFHSCQYITGKLFPNEVFLQSGRTGIEQTKLAIQRMAEWFEKRERRGLFEHNSGAYMPITQAALLNVYDFCDAFSENAGKILDLIYKKLAMHTFGGVVFAPQGRMYRDGIYPYNGGTNGMMYYFYPEIFAECYTPWMAMMYTSKYKLPDLLPLIHGNIEEKYIMGNCEIQLNKTKDYILTSNLAPNSLGDDGNVPGTLSGQRQLMFAAISEECSVFVNHPGSSNDLTLLRPGYWNGNGICPEMHQNENEVEIIYNIPDSYPVSFTHVFFPVKRFDRVEISENSLKGFKNGAYIEVTCSEKLIKFDDVLQDCEFRAYNNHMKWIIKCKKEE